MSESFRGGLKSPRTKSSGTLNEATILTLVAQGMGVGFVVEDRPLAVSDGVAE